MDLRKTTMRASAVLASVVLCTATSFGSEMASATVVGTPMAGGSYSYSLTLNDTGTTPIGTFWFSWVPGAGFLTAVPTSVGSPSGWTEKATNSGAAIQWTTTTSALNPGGSLAGFSFVSTETPGQLQKPVTVTTATASFTEPGSVFFVYQGTPLAAGDPGFQATATVLPTPEPSSVVLMGTGLLGVAGALRRRLLRRQ